MNRQHRYPTRIHIHPDQRSLAISLLNQTLANSIDLKAQVKQAQWNVKGQNFYQLYSLFAEIATKLEEYIDILAERITILGGHAFGTVRVVADKSIILEYPHDIVDGTDHVTALADRIGAYARALRVGIGEADQIGDIETQNLYIELSRSIDKTLWFLDAYLFKPPSKPFAHIQTQT
jgi:starvation-inducible DNA-binding protein